MLQTISGSLTVTAQCTQCAGSVNSCHTVLAREEPQEKMTAHAQDRSSLVGLTTFYLHLTESTTAEPMGTLDVQHRSDTRSRFIENMESGYRVIDTDINVINSLLIMLHRSTEA